MKITFFIGRTKGGGAQRVVCNLANELVSFENEVQILTVKISDSYGLDERIERVCLGEGLSGSHSIFNRVEKMKRLKAFLKKNRTDVYIVFLPVEICMFMHYRRYVSVPIILSERNDPSRNFLLLRVLLKYYASKAQGMVFQTGDARKWYGKLAGMKTAVIPNPVNPDFIISDNEYKRNYCGDIVGIGRLSSQKNWPMLIKAYSLLDRTIRDKHRLVIYGEGAERQNLIDLCKMLKVGDGVELPGFTDSVREVLEAACIYVMSSDYEGMPNALMEAMAMGLPCISTDCPVGGPRFLINHGVNGILVPVSSAEEMATAIRALLEDEKLADRMGINARGIGDDFAPDKIFERWWLFIREVNEIEV